jgi:hypothetical protein
MNRKSGRDLNREMFSIKMPGLSPPPFKAVSFEQILLLPCAEGKNADPQFAQFFQTSHKVRTRIAAASGDFQSPLEPIGFQPVVV